MSQWKVKNGNTWEAIPAGGVGVPSGGTQGQVLVKASNADYDTEWETDTSKVSKTGDTMTGALRIRSSNIQDGTQSEVYGSGELALHDANGVRFGYFLPMAINGAQGIQFSSVRTLLDENNEPYDAYHGLSLYIDANGGRSVYVSDAEAWLDALGLGTPTHISTISQVATAATGFSISNVSYYQWGRIAQWGITVTRTGAAITSEQSVTVCTIVSGKRPIQNTTIAGSNTQISYGSVNTSGVCTLRVTGWSQNNEKTFRAMYFLA